MLRSIASLMKLLQSLIPHTYNHKQYHTTINTKNTVSSRIQRFYTDMTRVRSIYVLLSEHICLRTCLMFSSYVHSGLTNRLFLKTFPH
jgi:hypothetical protein